MRKLWVPVCFWLLVCPSEALPQEALGKAIPDLLEWVHEVITPDKIDAFTDARFKEIAGRAGAALEWSGKQGVLVEVPVAVHKDENFRMTLPPEVVGPGSSMVEAAAIAFERPKSRIGTPESYRVSAEKSYFVWVTKSKKGALRFTPQPAEGTKLFLDHVRERAAILSVDKLAKRALIYDVTLAALDRQRRIATSMRDRAQSTQLISSFSSLTARLNKNEAKLKAEIDAANQLARAAQTLDQFAGALTIAAALATSVANLEAADRNAIETAQTSEGAKSEILKRYGVHLSEATRIDAAVAKDATELGLRRTEVKLLLNSGGIPYIVETIVEQPIAYGVGPEFKLPPVTIQPPR